MRVPDAEASAPILVAGARDELTEHLRASLSSACGDCRLIEHPWNGYAAFKNWAIPQATHEWVLVLRGRAGLELEGRDGVVELGPGDFLDLPAHRKHRVAWTAADEPTVWLAVHYGCGIGGQ